MYATLSIQGFAFVVLLVCTDDLVEAIHFASSVRHGGQRRFARGKHICCLTDMDVNEAMNQDSHGRT